MNLNEIIELDSKHFMNTFGARTPVCFEYGKGIHLYDIEGKMYTDFFAGIAVNALGHSHPAIVDAITKQASKFIHCSNLYYIKQQALLAKLLTDVSCADRIFFSNSGAEANEGALKLARAYFKKKGQPNKYSFICLEKSFHGRTITTATATGQEKYSKPFAPLTPGFKHVPINDFDALSKAVDENTCAILLEPVQGESGVHPLTKDYVTAVRKLCDEKGIFLIFDEVQTGLGRTGKLFGYQLFDVEPDIFTLAKALGAGFPIGAVCAKEEAAKGFEPGDHGTTFGGNPLACAVALASVTAILDEHLSENAANMGDYLASILLTLSDKIIEVRHVGLMFAIDFKEPIAVTVKQKLFEKGLLVGNVGTTTLRVLPPLIITKSDINYFICVLMEIL